MATLTLTSAAKQAMAELILARIDAGGAAGKVEIQDSSNNVLATLTLAYPCGAHSAGKLVFSSIAQVNATGTGTANKAVFKTSAGVEVFTGDVSTSAGTAFCRLSSLSIATGGPVATASCEIQF